MSCGLPTAKFAMSGSPNRAQIGPLKKLTNGATVSNSSSRVPAPGRSFMSLIPSRAVGRGSAFGFAAGVGRGLAHGRATLGGRSRAFLAFGGLGLLALGDDRDLLDLDARRLDLGDDFVGIGEQRHVVRDHQVADVDRRV